MAFLLILSLLVVASSAFQPPILPHAFNTSFVMTFAGNAAQPHKPAFWAYDSAQGGQYVWHPICPFWKGEMGCSLFFAGGYEKPVVYAVQTQHIFGPPMQCCLFFTGVPILPPDTFNKYQFVINTTIIHEDVKRGGEAVTVGMFSSQNRQCFSSDGENLERILDVTTIWDLPPVKEWQVGSQPSSLFAVPKVCSISAPACSAGRT